MPIEQRSIDSFLNRELPYVPVFKGRDPKHLHDLIRARTGHPYQPKTEPRPHQLEGVAFSVYQGRSLLFYSPRLGKTKIALDWAQQLRSGEGLWKGKGLIIVHAPIALWVWETEAEKHSNLKIAPVRNKLSELIAALESDADLVAIPWSGLQNIFSEMRKDKRGKNKLFPDLEGARILAQEFSLVIIDEIHTAKNWQSLRFKLAKEIVGKCKYRLGLTGTPFGRNPFDVWAQAYLIDAGVTLGYVAPFFEAAFGTKKTNYFTGYDEYIFDKKKQKLLEHKLSAISLAYKLEECQYVPVMAGTVDLNMTGDQKHHYFECIEKLIRLENNQTVEIQATFVRLRQISSGYLPFIGPDGSEGEFFFKNNSKLEWLIDFMEGVEELKNSVIIVHEFTSTGKMLCDTMTKLKIRHGWLHGATKDKPGVVRDFQNGKITVIVLQAATGGMAIDLHRADHLIFFESPASGILRDQVAARPLSAARGTRTLLVDDLTTSGVERKILSYVSEGKSLVNAIVHDRKILKEGDDERSHGETGGGRKPIKRVAKPGAGEVAARTVRTTGKTKKKVPAANRNVHILD